MLANLKYKIENKRVCLLGFGQEGQSTCRYIRKHLPEFKLSVADKNEALVDSLPESIKEDANLDFITGKDYLNQLMEFDVIIKSPGITLHTLNGIVPHDRLTSQTDLFLGAYHDQIIGVTGTKGKSTTVSLIHHLISQETDNVLLVGNIGTPPLDHIAAIDQGTIIIFELSSHQLEMISRGPGVAVLLNLLSEHLDRFKDIQAYHASKLNIIKYQDNHDHLIFNYDDKYLSESISSSIQHNNSLPYSLEYRPEQGCFVQDKQIIYALDHLKGVLAIDEFQLIGQHNLTNLMAAVLACKIKNIGDDAIKEGISSFKGLRHRLEYVGKYGGIHFYNDSIATIPEATMEAVKALGDVDTLILGGYDRMINYNELVSFLVSSNMRNIICTGAAGRRIYKGLKEQNANQALFQANDYNEVFEIIKVNSSPDGICLLSPAAASYDMFKNFEERGDLFAILAKSI